MRFPRQEDLVKILDVNLFGIAFRMNQIAEFRIALQRVDTPAGLDKQRGAYVKKLRQFFRLCLADRTLAMKHLGSNSFRSEGFPKIFLRQVARLHQMLKYLPRTRFPNDIAARLI